MYALGAVATWNTDQYLKFGDERTRAARELLARVPDVAAHTVVDLGCGPANSTALLCSRFPNARVIGVDSSKEMLTRARQDLPAVTWVEADLREYKPDGPVDVLYANAVMQWVPDHARLFPELLERVRPGGVLAVQVPRNFEEPSHRLMRETDPDGSPVSVAWRDRLANVRALTPVESPEFYYDLLAPRATSVDVWQTTYHHVMSSAEAIVEWVKGTGLRPYLDALPEAERSIYLERYTARIAEAYPARSDGKHLFRFPRLFVVAVR